MNTFITNIYSIIGRTFEMAWGHHFNHLWYSTVLVFLWVDILNIKLLVMKIFF